MEKIYDFLQRHKWLLWTAMVGLTILFVVFGIRCRLEEDIFKLLPKMDESSKSSLVFTDIKLKDKVMVQAVRAEGVTPDSVDNETLALAMDLFMETVLEADSQTHTLSSALYEIDPMMLIEIGSYVMEHGVSYLDFTEEEMDTLISEEHIRRQIRMYEEILDTETGQYIYDLIDYDPCGLSMKNFDIPSLLNGNPDESRIQYNHIFAGKGNTCIGFLTPTFGPQDSKTARKMFRHFETAQQAVQATYPGVDILSHGTVILSAYNGSQIKHDGITTLGLALAIIILLLAILMKRPRYMALMLIPIIFGAFASLAGIYWARGWMSLMALGLGVIVLGVALSYCLHVVVHYIYTGDARQTVREQSKPVFLGALTTIGAFAGLLFTQSSLLQDFGAFALLTIIGTTAVSLIVMPHCFPRKSTPNRHAFRMLERINSYRFDRNLPICILVLLWIAVTICFSGKYEFDSNLRNIGYIAPETQRAMDNWNRDQNEGLSQQYFAAMGNDLNEALEQLPAIEAVEDSLYHAGVILKPLKMSALLPSLSKQEERIERWQQYFTPARRQEAWRNICHVCEEEDIDPDMFAAFREQMEMPTEPELIAEAGILPDELLGNFVEETGGETLVFFSVRAEKDNMLQAKNALSADDLSLVLDPYYYGTNLVELIHEDFSKIMLISSIFVLVLLLITYRNIWLALIAFLPMILSWYSVLGAMALFHQSFNLLNIVVSSFIFGIGVDYSIFIMDGLIRGDKSKTMVYHKTAITMSATILIICMFSLQFAVHPALHSMGFVSVTGMITTLLLSYTLQPRCYRAYFRIRQYGIRGFISHYRRKHQINKHK